MIPLLPFNMKDIPLVRSHHILYVWKSGSSSQSVHLLTINSNPENGLIPGYRLSNLNFNGYLFYNKKDIEKALTYFTQESHVK